MMKIKIKTVKLNPMAQKNGFTLIEIMITISIIAIVGAMLMYALDPFTQFNRGYDGVRRADLAKLKVAFENYYEDHLCYPDPSILDTCGATTLAPYIDIIPCDPITKQPYVLYTNVKEGTCPQNFVVYAKLASYFNPSETQAPTCADTTVVHSGGVESGDVARGCSLLTVCPFYYGCVSGACVRVAEDDIPPCSPAYCQSANGGANCVGDGCCFSTNCALPQNECNPIVP